MKKRIHNLTIEAKQNVKGKITICILEQKKRGFTFSASNGFEIRSGSFPDVPTSEDSTLFVRGGNRRLDQRIMKVPNAAYLQNLRLAIHEFNGTLIIPEKIVDDKPRKYEITEIIE